MKRIWNVLLTVNSVATGVVEEVEAEAAAFFLLCNLTEKKFMFGYFFTGFMELSTLLESEDK